MIYLSQIVYFKDGNWYYASLTDYIFCTNDRLDFKICTENFQRNRAKIMLKNGVKEWKKDNCRGSRSNILEYLF